MEIFNGHATIVITLLFLVDTFFQSGIDKITDWKGNVAFISDHFKNSPLKNIVPLLVGILLVLELLASFLMITGIYELTTSGAKEFAQLGAELASISLIFIAYFDQINALIKFVFKVIYIK